MGKESEKGYTLIELMIVIAIAGVALAAIVFSTSILFSNRTKSAAKNIYNMIGTAQTVGMSKEEVFLKLSADSNGLCSVGIVAGKTNTKEIENKEIGSNLNIRLCIGTETNEMALVAGKTYYIGINRRTGGFTGTFGAVDGTSMGDCIDIKVGEGSNSFDIGLVKLTGKYFYK